MISPPTVPRRREAPITATDSGARTLRTAAIAAVASRASKRARPASSSAVGNRTDTRSGAEWTSTGNPLSRNTAIIRWFSGSTIAVNVATPWS